MRKADDELIPLNRRETRARHRAGVFDVFTIDQRARGEAKANANGFFRWRMAAARWGVHVDGEDGVGRIERGLQLILADGGPTLTRTVPVNLADLELEVALAPGGAPFIH